jgi:hypothetical protein
MLPLDSERWSAFDTFGSDPSDLPVYLARLEAAVGTPEENAAWREVRDVFYCQNRIRPETAFAAIPHAVPLLSRMAPASRLDAVIDVGMIEAARGQRPVPDDLFRDEYAAAIRQAQGLALDLVSNVVERESFVYLLGAVASLSGHDRLGDILYHIGSLGGTCPKCGEWVDAEEVQGSGYG